MPCVHPSARAQHDPESAWGRAKCVCLCGGWGARSVARRPAPCPAPTWLAPPPTLPPSLPPSLQFNIKVDSAGRVSQEGLEKQRVHLVACRTPAEAAAAYDIAHIWRQTVVRGPRGFPPPLRGLHSCLLRWRWRSSRRAAAGRSVPASHQLASHCKLLPKAERGPAHGAPQLQAPYQPTSPGTRSPSCVYRASSAPESCRHTGEVCRVPFSSEATPPAPALARAGWHRPGRGGGGPGPAVPLQLWVHAVWAGPAPHGPHPRRQGRPGAAGAGGAGRGWAGRGGAGRGAGRGAGPSLLKGCRTAALWDLGWVVHVTAGAMEAWAHAVVPRRAGRGVLSLAGGVRGARRGPGQASPLSFLPRQPFLNGSLTYPALRCAHAPGAGEGAVQAGGAAPAGHQQRSRRSRGARRSSCSRSRRACLAAAEAAGEVTQAGGCGSRGKGSGGKAAGGGGGRGGRGAGAEAAAGGSGSRLPATAAPAGADRGEWGFLLSMPDPASFASALH